MNAQETFAYTIKEHLLAAGYSYKKFGDAVGMVPHQTVSRWVNGKGLPEFERLLPMANALGLDYDLLHKQWIEAISERSRRLAGEPIDSVITTLSDNLPNTRAELEEIKKRMALLEREIRSINNKNR